MVIPCIDRYSTYWKIFNRIRENAVILDVGVGYGTLGELLIKHKNCTVYGIDINPENARKAIEKGYKYVFVVDLDYAGNELYKIFEQKFFDYIIFADVLEHLKEPLMLLVNMRPLLKNNGHILISIPNIALWIIRLKLLLGKWEYQENGVLDKTHLRFFTIESAKRLIEQAGFKVMWEDYTPYIPAIPKRKKQTENSKYKDQCCCKYNIINNTNLFKFKIFMERVAKGALQWIARLRPTLFAVQIVMEAAVFRDNLSRH